MNIFTKDIAALLGIDLKDARKVQDYIDSEWLLDWSECSTRQFNKVVREVAKVVLA